MVNSQYIDKKLMAQVRICKEYRKVRGEKINIAIVLNEIIALGLEKYAEERGVVLSQMSRKDEGEEENSR